MRRMKTILPVLVVFLLLVAACSGGANEAATQTAESEAATEVARGVEETAEARSQEETQVAEDAAAEEAEAEAAAAAEAEAAAAAAEAKATADAEAAEAAAAAAAEAAVLASINDVLQEVGHSTDFGSLSWSQASPITLSLSGGGGGRYIEIAGDQEYKDFVIHFDVTWDTSGIAGCGLIFRSEEDLRDGEQYIFNTLRFSGLPGWDVELHDFGQFKANVTGEVKYTNKIKLENGATNNYILVAEGATLTVYINGSRISSVTIFTRSEGYFGYYMWQSDGSTDCAFENGWIWELP